LTDEPLPEPVFARPAFRSVGVTGKLPQARLGVDVVDDVHRALLRVHQRCEFGEQRLRDRDQVALPLQHPAELG
jgi:hypothetical protein